MNAISRILPDLSTLATEIATEHVDDCLERRQGRLTIARVLFGPDWDDGFVPTRGMLVEAYARAWLGLSAGGHLDTEGA